MESMIGWSSPLIKVPASRTLAHQRFEHEGDDAS